MTAGNWFGLAFGFGWPALCGLFWALDPAKVTRRRAHAPFGRRFAEMWLSCAAAAAAGWLIGRAWAYLAGAVVSVALAAAVWLWLRRKNRGKAGALIGAKSRALLAAIVRKARESAKPSPVLKPSLRGAS